MLQLSRPDLAFEPGTTGGIVSSIIDMHTLTSSANVAAIHHVSRDITVGGTTSPSVDLLAGDLLLTVAWSTNLMSTSSIIVESDDVFIFRPDTAGDYSSGTFIMLLDNLAGSSIAITGISLVEQDTVVGGQTLQAGTFLYSRSWNAHKNKIYHFTADDVGASTTSGTSTVLVDGSDISMGGTSGGAAAVAGLDFIEHGMSIGGTTLQSGQVLVTLDEDDNSVGNGTPIVTTKNDIFILDVTATGKNTTHATAMLFLDGSDINLDPWIGVDAFSLAPMH